MAELHSQISLGEFLVREGLITQAQFNTALDKQNDTARSIGRILVELDLITEPMRMTILNKQFGYELINLENLNITRDTLALIPYSFAEKHRTVPISLDSDTDELAVAMEDPSDIMIVDAIKNQVGMSVKAYLASRDHIRAVLDSYPESQSSRSDFPAAAVAPVVRGPFYRLLRTVLFPILALSPLVLFLVCLAFNVGNLADTFQYWISQGQLTGADLGIYLALSWAIWAILLYELQGIVFKSEDGDGTTA